MNPNLNPESSASQKARIKAWLQAGNSITPLEALSRFGCLRLSAIVFDLKKDGMDIATEIIKTESGKRVAEYKLNK